MTNKAHRLRRVVALATVIGALLGRKAVSASTVGRATTAGSFVLALVYTGGRPRHNTVPHDGAPRSALVGDRRSRHGQSGL